MPSASLISPLIDMADKGFSPEQLTLTLETLQTKRRLRAALTRMDECRSASCYTLSWIWKQRLFRQYQQQQAALSRTAASGQSRDSLVFLNRTGEPLADGDAIAEIAMDWATSSAMMEDLLSARGVPYFHFLQPNQYYPTQRRFGDGEKQVAFDANSTVRAGVELGYPKLIAKMADMRVEGVTVFDGTSVFDEVSAPVYVDSCCHYTPLGNEVFANYVARGIVSSLRAGAAAQQRR